MSDAISAIAMNPPVSGSDRFAADAVQVDPTQGDIDAFAAQMNRAPDVGAIVPEQQLFEQVQNSAAIMNARLQEVMPSADEVFSPERALALQKELSHQAKTADIAAKVVGSVSQTLKQLLAMQ